MSFVEVNKVSCEVSQVPDLWFFEISCITAESYVKRKKYFNAGTTTKDTQKAHSQMEHSIPRAEQKQAQSLSRQPRSTPTGRQICLRQFALL